MPDYQKMYAILRDAVGDVIPILHALPQTRTQAEHLQKALRQTEALQTEWEEA